MSRPGLLRVCLLALPFVSSIAWCADAGDSGGAPLYAQFCASCHDHPKDRIPPREAIAKRTPDEMLQALNSGLMRVQAGGLNTNERIAVVTYLTGKPPLGTVAAPPEKNRCEHASSAAQTASQWNGWGRDLDNSHFQPQPGFTAADVPRLKVKWAFGYRGTYIYGQPTIVGGSVYLTSSSGRVYSLDARTGCTHWTFDAPAPARGVFSIIRSDNSKELAVFGDDSGTVYALDAKSGAVVWKRRLDPHPAARITGAPVYYGNRLYVPVASLEELSAPVPTYECCKFRGSVAALDARTGQVIWQTYTIEEKPHPYRKSKAGTQLYGPAGGAVWSAPTLDPKRNLLYVGTGNSYTDVPAARTDSIVALDMTTGAVKWVNQARSGDNYIVSCDGPATAGQGNCPQTPGPDVDFGTSPILRTLPGGRQVLLTGQKSGQVYGLDPETGKQLWTARVGAGSSVGGIEWGGAADESQMYVAVSDAFATTGKPGGLTALRIDTGKQVWRAAPPSPVCSWGPRNCSVAQSQAVAVMPGAVFSGSQDGHLRAYSATDGHVIWDFDTAQPFDTVNAIAAAGGSLDHGSATMAEGMLFVNSGYGRINGQPGNVFLAFAPAELH
jgi:polyvinyl alcohol dehydrogenase (cytochrome)